MRPRPHNQEQIARRPAIHARIALALQPDPLSIARPRLDAKLHSFALRDCPFTVAGYTRFRRAPCPIAAGARNVELHPPAHLRHLARAVALRTLHHAARKRLPVACGTSLLPVHLDARLPTANRRPEIHRRLVLKIGSRLRPTLLLRLLHSRKNSREDVLEAAPSRARLLRRRMSRTAKTSLKSREIEPVKVHLLPPAARALLPRVGLGRRRVNLVGVEPQLVIHLPLLLVAQNIVGLGDLLELLLRLLVSRIHVGVILARSFP